MNPASTMKLVTTYSALHLLGPAFTFRTEVLADGAAGRRRAARRSVRARRRRSAPGDRKPVAAGQPAARLRHPRHPRRPGARQDASSSRCRTIPAEFDGEEGRAYNVGPDALLVNFKSIAITLRARHRRARWRASIVVPEVAGLKCPRTRAGRRGRLRRLARPAAGRHQRPDEHPHRAASIHWPAASAPSTSARSNTLTTSPRCSARCGNGRAARGTARCARAPCPPARAAGRRAGIAAARHAHPRHQQVQQQRDDAAAVPHHGRGRRRSPATRRAARPRCAACWRRAASTCPELILENGCGLSRIERISRRHPRQRAGRRLEEPVDAASSWRRCPSRAWTAP